MNPTAFQAPPADDPLDDFARRVLTLVGETRTVLVAGQGPGVVVLPEMPGISPDVARFARWVRDAGFRVYIPSLFGTDGAFPRVREGLEVLKRACVAAEFRAMEAGIPTPISTWLRALAAQAHAECGGPGVGAIGMCFTGNFALGMLLEPAVLAPVMCQPSLPLTDPDALHSPPEELAQMRARLERDDLTVMGFRFDGDRFCTAARFSAYQQALGPRFVPTVLPSAAANPAPPPFFRALVGCAHSVVTAHLKDAAGEPTVAARDSILAFLSKQLKR